MPNSLDGSLAGKSAEVNEEWRAYPNDRLESMADAAFMDYLRRNGVEIRAEEGKLKLSADRGFLTEALQEELRRRKQSLLEYLSVRNSKQGKDAWELSYAQERLWLLSRFGANGATYNIPQAWRLDDEVDEQALKTAIRGLVRRHSSLGCRIVVRGGTAVQVEVDEPEVSMQTIDARGRAAEFSSDERVLAQCVDDGRKPFDLEAGPLIRFVLFKFRDKRDVLFMCVHHIVADQHSLNVLKRDLRELYKSVLAKSEPILPAIEYINFKNALEERAFARSAMSATQLAYWRERLKAAPSLLELPFSKNRPARPSDDGERYVEYLDHSLAEGLRDLAADANASLYTMMLSIFAILLYRYVGDRDFCVGTPKSTRKRSEQAETVGLFLNMLPIRCAIDPNETIVQMVNRLQDSVLRDFEHGDVPFQMIVDELKPERSESYSPLFQIMFSLNPKGIAKEQEEEELEIDLGIAKYDLSLQISEKKDVVEAHFEFRTQLFDRREVQRLARHLKKLAQSVVESRMMSVAHLLILCDEDRVAIGEFNNTDLQIDRSATIVGLFEEQSLSSPDAVALLSDDGSYTYRLLNEKAQEAASRLLDAGIQRGTLVGVCLNRNVELIVALLAIFKAGAAYLPLDPKYPAERIEYMLRDSGALYLIADGAELSPQTRDGLPWLNTLRASELFKPATSRTGSYLRHEELSGRVIKPEDMAYVIYTSGSTGAPKGTVVEHRNVVALLAWANSYFDLESRRYVVASTSVCFDLSVFELFFPLTTGNAVILIDSILDLSKSQYAQRATLINTVPSAMRALLATGLPPSVQAVCLAGELLPTELVDRIYETGVKRVFDLYGPTETTTYSTCGLRVARVAPNIGRPIANTRIYLLDENLQQVPVGALGEIVIGGMGVTRGYLNREELTQEKFVSIPSVDPDSRLYRTGDLAIQSSDGTLIYKGRRDHQIKLRGYRIELGEVESVLSEIGNGSQVAIVVSEQGGGAVLSAFIEGPSMGLAEEAIKGKLKGHLPEFMIPGYITWLDRLPRTPSGKVDRAALMRWRIVPRTSTREFPATFLEQAVANIFAAKLHLSEVDRNAHFFAELGGHSLAAFEIFVEIEQQLHVSMTPNVLFQTPSVKLLAAAIECRAWHQPARIRLIREGSSETVVYWVGSGLVPQECISAYGGLRVMSLEIGSDDEIGLAAAEVVSFETSKPKLIVIGSEPRQTLIRQCAAMLSGESFVVVEIVIAPPLATFMG